MTPPHLNHCLLSPAPHPARGEPSAPARQHRPGHPQPLTRPRGLLSPRRGCAGLPRVAKARHSWPAELAPVVALPWVPHRGHCRVASPPRDSVSRLEWLTCPAGSGSRGEPAAGGCGVGVPRSRPWVLAWVQPQSGWGSGPRFHAGGGCGQQGQGGYKRSRSTCNHRPLMSPPRLWG